MLPRKGLMALSGEDALLEDVLTHEIVQGTWAEWVAQAGVAKPTVGELSRAENGEGGPDHRGLLRPAATPGWATPGAPGGP